MKTDAQIETLRSLQDILLEKYALEKEIADIPKELSRQEETLARMKKIYIEKNAEYDKARQTGAEFKNLLAEAEAAREKAEKTIEIIQTQREYEALDKEQRDAAEKEQHYRKDYQRQEKIVNDLDEQMKQSAALIEQQEKDLNRRRKEIQAQISEKNSAMHKLGTKQNNLSKNMDGEVLFKFERIIRNKMGEGIVAIKGQVCMGCHMILPAQFANLVRLGEEIVFCPYCSRALFYEESEEGDEELFDDADSGSLQDLADDDDDFDDDDDDSTDDSSGDFEE